VKKLTLIACLAGVAAGASIVLNPSFETWVGGIPLGRRVDAPGPAARGVGFVLP
jgi:hypothetical protein